MRTRMMVLAALAAAACGGSKRPAPAPAPAPVAADAPAAPAAPATSPPAAPAGPRDPLLGQIPHDTPYLFVSRDQGTDRSTGDDAMGKLRDQIAPLMGMITPDMMKDMDDGDRMFFAAAHMLVNTDAAAMARIGLDRPDLRVVFYGLGLVPVLRLEIDGKAAREHYAASAAWAQVKAPFADWHGHAYASWPIGDRAVMVAVFDEHQVAVALGRRATDVLPHLVGDAPPARPLDEAAATRAAGVTGELTMWFDTERMAALLDGGLAPLVEAPAGCGPALAAVFRGLAPMVASRVVAGGLVTTRSRVGPVPTLAAALRPGIHPIAHWPAEPPPPRVIHYGAGTSFEPFVSATAGVARQLFAAIPACGGDPTDDTALAPLMAAGAASVNVTGFTVVGRVGAETAPPQLAAIADADDPVALYRLAAGMLDLPPRPPAFDKPTKLTVAGNPTTLILHRKGLSGSVGRHDAAAVAALRAAPPGPATIFLMRGGGNPDDPGARHPFTTSVTLDGDNLVFEDTRPR